MHDHHPEWPAVNILAYLLPVIFFFEEQSFIYVFIRKKLF